MLQTTEHCIPLWVYGCTTVVPLSALFCYWCIKIYRNYKRVSGIPGTIAFFFLPFKLPILSPVFHLGNWNEILKHATKFGDANGNLRVSFVDYNYLLISKDRNMVKEMLMTKQASFDKPKIVYDMFNVFGENILSALSTEKWKKHHKICNSAFSSENLKLMCDEAVVVVDLLSDMWNERIDKSVDKSFLFIQDEFSMVTLEVLGRSGFSMSFGLFEKDDKGRLFRNAIEKLFSSGIIIRRFLDGIPLIYSLMQKISGVEHAIGIINQTLDEAIDSRRSEIQKDPNLENFSKKDILSLLVKANTQEQNLLTDQELKSNSLIFTLAGEETTSTALQWVIYELAKHPQYQEKAREEIRTILEERKPNYDDYDKLYFVNACFLEALRLHPPFSSILKQTNKNIILGPYNIPKGTTVECSVLGIHHCEEYWPQPLQFNPYRFMNLELRSKCQHDCSFLSFSMGMRKCIVSLLNKSFIYLFLKGFNFAKIEGCIVIARLLQKFQFELLNEEDNGDLVRGGSGLSTRPINLKVKITRL